MSARRLLTFLIMTCCGCSSVPTDTAPRSELHSSRSRIAEESVSGTSPTSRADLPTPHASEYETPLMAEPENAPQEPLIESDKAAPIIEAGFVQDSVSEPNSVETEPTDLPADNSIDITLDRVIDSVHRSYPLVYAAFQEREIANGNQLAAWGEFDTKVKAASESGPLGFYETYRNNAGFESPIYHGGEFFGGYRAGRGSFQPWYKERQTDDSGEFKAGVRVPLIRNREIDRRRADLWRATYDQQIANPVIRRSLIVFSREAGFAYWKWVAAGRKYLIDLRWLELAAARNEQIERRVELEDLDPPELIDNRRAIAKRRSKLESSLRVLQQSAIKLSLYLRDDQGHPYVPSIEDIPAFPELRQIDPDLLERDIRRAQQSRPELEALQLELQRLQVDFAEACNLTRPGLDAQLAGSQDVGPAATKKRDKSDFELEAGLFFDVPLQRRKGRGKMHAVQAKMSQVTAKRNLVQDKVAAEVRAVYAGLEQSFRQASQAQRAVELALRMAEIELRKFELGESDLLKVALREQIAVDAAEATVMARLSYFFALTDYAASLAVDRPSVDLVPETVAE